MRLVGALINIIIYVIATAQAPVNTSNTERVSTTEENVTAPIFSKLIGGTPKRHTEFPAIAALVTRRIDKVSECTGTVLNDYFVLTAGHCIFDAMSITIYIGCTYLYDCREAKAGVAVLHPRYDMVDRFIYNDIGLVRSISRFTTAEYAFLSTVTSYQQDCVVLGYGFTSENLVETTSNLHELRILHVIPCTYFFPPVLVNHMISTMVCSETKDNRRYSFGDSGGPLLCNKVQVGITSQLITLERDGVNESIMSWVPVGLYVEWIEAKLSCSSRPRLTILFPIQLLLLMQFIN